MVETVLSDSGQSSNGLGDSADVRQEFELSTVHPCRELHSQSRIVVFLDVFERRPAVVTMLDGFTSVLSIGCSVWRSDEPWNESSSV